MDSKQQEAAAAVVGTPSEDSISMKTEYNPTHEVFVSEPLPAYKLKTRPTAVQIARIAAFTVIACTFIMGSFMLGAAWLQANASCSQLMHAEALLRQSEEAADRPQYQALVDPLQSDETSDSKQELPGGHQPSVRNAESQTVDAAVENEQPAAPPVQIKLPLELDFDEIVSALLEKNQRSRMNCVIEKKRAEEVMDHQPKTLRLPFGLNITTDPRFEHVTGERLSIVCDSGLDERRAPNPAEQMQQQSSMMMPIPMGGNPMTHLPSMMGPPPPPSAHHAQHHPHHMHQGPPPIPLAMIARINADIDNQLQLQEQQQIEEHIIPIFQQLLPELRQAPDGGHMMREQHHQQQQQQQHQQQHQHQQHHKQQMQMQEAEDRASAMMPGKVLYHPAMAAEDRPLYTVAISDKQMANGEADGPPMMMHQENGPSETARHNVAAPMFHRVPINVPVSMMMPPPGSALSPSAPQDNPTDDSKPEHRPHFVHPRSVESVQEEVVQN